jgi:hypothetical protein
MRQMGSIRFQYRSLSCDPIDSIGDALTALIGDRAKAG